MKDKLLLMLLLGSLITNIHAQGTDLQIVESILKENNVNWDIDERVTMEGERITRLNLNGDIATNWLTVLSPDIGKLKELKVLTINDNELFEIPEEVYNLTKLTTLEIKSNSLQRLPEGISKLVLLEELDLRHNELTQLPDDITDLESINKLQLWGNKLVSLPNNIGELHTLKELYLMNNRLLSLPESITKLTLFYLDVSYNYLKDSDANVDTWLKKYNKNYRTEQFDKKRGDFYL